MKFSAAGSSFIKFSNSIIKCFDYISCKIPFVSHRLFVCIRICWRTGRRNRWRKGDNFLFRSATTACMKSLNTPCMNASLPASPAGHTIANLSGKLQKFGRNRISWCFPEVTPVSDLLCFVFVAFSLSFDIFHLTLDYGSWIILLSFISTAQAVL